MKIIVTKHSKDGLATVTFEEENATTNAEQAKQRADDLLDKAGAVLNTRFKQMKAKEKEKARRNRDDRPYSYND